MCRPWANSRVPSAKVYSIAKWSNIWSAAVRTCRPPCPWAETGQASFTQQATSRLWISQSSMKRAVEPGEIRVVADLVGQLAYWSALRAAHPAGPWTR